MMAHISSVQAWLQEKKLIYANVTIVVVVTVLSNLILLYPLPFAQKWIALVLGFIAIFLVPGYLTSIVFTKEISFSARLPLAFVLSCGLLSIPAVIVANLSLTLKELSWTIVFLNISMLSAYLLSSGRYKQCQKSDFNFLSKSDKLTYILFAIALLAILWMLSWFISTAVVWHGGDRWVYLAYIRQFLDLPRLDVTEPFFDTGSINLRMALNSWLVLLALYSSVTSVDPVSIFSLYLPPALMMVSFFAFYSLAKELFQDKQIALLALIFQIIHYLYGLVTSGAGFYLFIAIPEDKYLAYFIFFPIVSLLALKYLDSRNLVYYIFFIVSLLPLTLLHPIGLPFFLLTFGAFATVHILFNRNKRTLIKIIFILLPALMFLTIPLSQRFIPRPNAFNINDASDPSLENRLQIQEDQLFVIAQEKNQYIVHPNRLFSPVTILAILLFPFLLHPNFRKLIVGQYLFSSTLILLLLLFNPFITPLFGKIVSPWMLHRFSWLLPSSLIVSFGVFKVKKLIDLKRTIYDKSRSNFVSYLPLFAPILSVLLLFMMNGTLSQGFEILQSRKKESVSDETLALVKILRNKTDASSRVLAPPGRINLQIPGYIGTGSVLTVRRSELADGIQKGVEIFYRKEIIDVKTISILKETKADLMILPSGSLLETLFMLMPDNFEKVYKNTEFVLFQINSDAIINHTIRANTYITQFDWSKAEQEFDLALQSNPQDALAHYGLGVMYESTGRLQQAIEHYSLVSIDAEIIDDKINHLLLQQGNFFFSEYIITRQKSSCEKAITIYRQVLTIDPNNAEAQQGLLQIQLATAEGTDIEEMLQILSITGSDLRWQVAQAYVGLAQRYQTPYSEQGETRFIEAAADNYRQALAVGPDVPAARQAVVEAYLSLGSDYISDDLLDQALLAYQGEIARHPERPAAYWELAAAYEQLGQPEAALDLYRQAAVYKPAIETPTPQAESFDQAVDDTIQLYSPGEAYLRLAEALARYDRPAEAVTAYQQALSLEPTLAQAYSGLGALYQAQGETDNAVSLYRQAAGQFPEQAWPRLSLGQIHLQQAMSNE